MKTPDERGTPAQGKENDENRWQEDWRKYREGNHLEFPDGSLWMINSRTGVAIKGTKKDIDSFENCTTENEEENPLIAAYCGGISDEDVIVLAGFMLSN